MTCKCVVCEECNGTGSVWYSFDGHYLGKSRCDDMDELDTCIECHGMRVVETCEECLEIERNEEIY